MKANQKFVRADEAVSPVIGVILMVAITVVLAAVVFVLVNNLSKTQGKSEDAGVQVTSPEKGVISVTLIRTGEHAPYSLPSVCGASNAPANCATIAVQGVTCVVGAAGNTNPGVTGAGTPVNAFSSGNSVRVNHATALATDCALSTNYADGQNNVQVTVTVAGTVIYDSSITIHQ